MNVVALLLLTALSVDPVDRIDFDSEIVPVLTKSGCNAGACHGAAAGRGEFHLSLLGADPAIDYDAIVRAFEGRRVNVVRPEESLLLRKASGVIEHGGESALDADGPGYERVVQWVREGARRATPRRLTRFEIEPDRRIAEAIPATVALKATAWFDDGNAEDVTPWTLFASADVASANVDDLGVATIRRPGVHVVTARYLGRVIPIQLGVAFSGTPIDLSQAPRANWIDDEILRTLEELRLPPSPAASDSEWLRRVTLDLTGRLPDPEQVESFLADPSGTKREFVVDRLLHSDAYADWWTLRLARLLRLRSLPNDSHGVKAYAAWLRQNIDADAGLDGLAHELLTATGDSHLVGPANFGRMVPDARGHAELFGEVFLGVQLGCANCHDHPFDRWTQDDYHGLAAIFARLDRGRHVRVLSRGEVTNLRTGEPAIPRIPGERYLEASASGEHDQVAQLSAWLRSDVERRFAKATVNRIWKTMFGRGLVEPADDLRATNPPTHPKLLDRLASEFAADGYRMRPTLKKIALSAAYGRSSAPVAGNAADDRFYSHAIVRTLSPETLADAIADLTGVADDYPGSPVGTRAVQLFDPLTPAPSLDVLGRCSRSDGCADDAPTAATLATSLHLLNGDLINRKTANPTGRLRRLIDGGATDAEIVETFYLYALARHPSESELAKWTARLQTADPDERRRRLEDFCWSLSNSRAFRENR